MLGAAAAGACEAGFGCCLTAAGLANGTATRLLVFGAAFGAACCCACDAADGAVAAAVVGFESFGGGGPADEVDGGTGVPDISAGFDGGGA